MIPTMVLFGLLLGRWWRPALLAGMLGWPLVLVLSGVRLGVVEVVVAASLGLTNTGIGVGLHQAVLHLVRWFARRNATSAGDG
jgi:hypothetical protein